MGSDKPPSLSSPGALHRWFYSRAASAVKNGMPVQDAMGAFLSAAANFADRFTDMDAEAFLRAADCAFEPYDPEEAGE